MTWYVPTTADLHAAMDLFRTFVLSALTSLENEPLGGAELTAAAKVGHSLLSGWHGQGWELCGLASLIFPLKTDLTYPTCPSARAGRTLAPAAEDGPERGQGCGGRPRRASGPGLR